MVNEDTPLETFINKLNDEIIEDIKKIDNSFLEGFYEDLKEGITKDISDEVINDFNRRLNNKKDRLNDCESEWKYLRNIETSREPDNSVEAKKFYKKNFEFYDEKRDSGETIVSFRTMAGCMIRATKEYKDLCDNGIRMLEKHRERLELILSANISKKIKVKFVELFYLTHTLANFIPLPKGKLNVSKGYSKTYHDFPDLFFKEIKNYVSIFMDDEMKKQWWRNLVEKNYLQPLFEDEEYEKFKKMAPDDFVKNEIPMPYKSLYSCDKKTKKYKLKYKEFCDKDGYITEKAIKNIFKRIDIFLENAINFIVERSFLFPM